MALPQVQRRNLSIENDGKPVASGGSALIYEVRLTTMTSKLTTGNYLFKEYKTFEINSVSVPHLNSIVDRIEGNKDAKLKSRLAVPLALVFRDKQFIGFLMKKLDQGCTFTLTRSTGATEPKLMTLDYFLASWETRSKLSVPELDPWRRWALLLDFWETISKLHENGVVIGDISHKNLVVLRKSGAKQRVRDRLLILDVDSFSTRTHLLNTKATTPLWEVPEESVNSLQEAKAADVYKAGLVTFRLLQQFFKNVDSSFSSSQSNLVTEMLQSKFSKPHSDLLASTISSDPNRRPTSERVFLLLDATVGRGLVNRDLNGVS